MKRSLSFIFMLIFGATAYVSADQSAVIPLPPPEQGIGKPLMQALMERRTAREFAEKELPLQVLSNLLWAACGVNRPDSGRRTAPTARNRQEIDVYAVLPHAVYLYDAKAHALNLITEGDHRALTGTQPYVKNAPLNLVYTADSAKMSEADADYHTMIAGADTGFISQNVYLFCASEGLATVVRALIDREKLAGILKLRPEQKITLSQSVGYPH